ncbi:MAG: hypothetical protein RSH78_05630 [Bacilli bacterium]
MVSIIVPKRRYIALKELAGRIKEKTNLKEKNDFEFCQSLVFNADYVNNEVEEKILLVNLFFPEDEEFLAKLESFDDSISKTATFYNCSPFYVLEKKKQIEMYEKSLVTPFKPKTNVLDNDDFFILSVANLSPDELKSRLFSFFKLNKFYERSVESSNEKIDSLEQEIVELKNQLSEKMGRN